MLATDKFATLSAEHWNSHRKGAQTRAKILAILAENPSATVEELATRVGVGKRQIQRQMSNLRAVGEIPVAA